MQDIKNKTMKITLAQILLPFIGIIILPSGVLIAWMCVALVADLITGILRAIIDNKIRTSQGYRETLAKVIQYGGALIIGIILGSIGKTHTHGVNPEVFEYFNDFLVSFIIFIEVTSIMENLYAIDSKSKLSKYFIKPVLALLTFNLEHTKDIIEVTKTITKKVIKNDK